MVVQKLYRTQISQFSQCMLQFLNNLPLNEETMKKRWTLLYRVCTYDTKKSPFGPALAPPQTAGH